jgi:putative restriction endonuclease
MNFYIAVTDNTWFNNLRYKQDVDEVNFWQPGEHAHPPQLEVGTPYLFKLHYPYNFIAGGGFFAHTTRISIRMAWDTFEEKNGAASYLEFRRLIKNKRGVRPSSEDFDINCIILVQPFFFEQKDWIPAPSDWRKPIVQGKTYDTSTEIGKKLWDDVALRLQKRKDIPRESRPTEHQDRYGAPSFVRRRLGQGAFSSIVRDIYNRRCAVTQERTFPTLEAAHIKPYAESGPHDIGNGILLRADIHHLLDSGYATVSPDYHFEVSKRIQEDFDNGEEYYKMHGSTLYVPAQRDLCPSSEFIKWHNENKFRG